MHPECKYCDNPMPPGEIGGDVVCSRCGAEWADARIMVEDEEYDDNDLPDLYEDELPDLEDDDLPDEDEGLGCVDCEDEIYTGHDEAGSYCESCGHRPLPIPEL
jgi:DNA-directed RNA polymerase subunit M/transcription elongation factor TFIIS